MTKLSTECPACKATVTLDEDAIVGLRALIDDERDEAADEAYAASEWDEPEGVTDLCRGERPLRALSVAIERGERVEAARLLDIIAERIGVEATEAVEQARYAVRRETGS